MKICFQTHIHRKMFEPCVETRILELVAISFISILINVLGFAININHIWKTNRPELLVKPTYVNPHQI